MYAQCNVDGDKYLLLECFVDIQKDPTAISLDKMKVIYIGRNYLQWTTLGWQECCQWKEDSMSFKKLLNVKE